MLSTDQLSHLDQAARELGGRKLLLKTAIDVQALLRLLVEKGIITKEEVNEKRNEVSQSSTYRKALLYIEETEREIMKYQSDPQAALKEMFRRKMDGE